MLHDCINEGIVCRLSTNCFEASIRPVVDLQPTVDEFTLQEAG
jgi:hypothetical protein